MKWSLHVRRIDSEWRKDPLPQSFLLQSLLRYITICERRKKGEKFFFAAKVGKGRKVTSAVFAHIELLFAVKQYVDTQRESKKVSLRMMKKMEIAVVGANSSLMRKKGRPPPPSAPSSKIEAFVPNWIEEDEKSRVKSNLFHFITQTIYVVMEKKVLLAAGAYLFRSFSLEMRSEKRANCPQDLPILSYQSFFLIVHVNTVLPA